MDLNAFFDHEFDEHEAVIRATRDTIGASFAKLCEALMSCGFDPAGVPDDVPSLHRGGFRIFLHIRKSNS